MLKSKSQMKVKKPRFSALHINREICSKGDKCAAQGFKPKKIATKIEDKLLKAQNEIMDQVITPIASPNIKEDETYLQIFDKFAEDYDRKVRRLEKAAKISKRYEYEDQKTEIQSKLQKASQKKNQFENFIHENKNQIVNDFSIPLKLLKEKMDVQQLIGKLEKYISQNIERAQEKFENNFQAHLKQQITSDSLFKKNSFDIRKDFYDKLNVNTKYKFLKDKIKDYIFYTDFMKIKLEGRQQWQYTLDNNPIKTKDYSAQCTNAKYMAKVDAEDIAYFKKEQLAKFMKEARTNDISEQNIKSLKKFRNKLRGDSAKCRWKKIRANKKRAVSFIKMLYKKRTSRQQSMSKDINQNKKQRQKWLDSNKREAEGRKGNLFDLDIYENMYDNLKWDAEKENKWRQCKLQKKIELGKLDTYRKENTVATKSFYQSKFIRPQEIKIVNSFREEKNCFFFLNQVKSNQRRIQQKINNISPGDFKKIEQKIANTVLAKFKRDQTKINQKRIKFLTQRTKIQKDEYNKNEVKKSYMRQLNRRRHSQQVQSKRMKNFIKVLHKDSQVPLKKRKLTSEFLQSGLWQKVKEKCVRGGAQGKLNSVANQYKTIKKMANRKRKQSLDKPKKGSETARILENRKKRIDYFKKAHSKSFQFCKAYTGGPAWRGFQKKRKTSKNQFLKAVVTIQSYAKKFCAIKKCQLLMRQRRREEQRRRRKVSRSKSTRKKI